jgi:RIO kinase 1
MPRRTTKTKEIWKVEKNVFSASSERNLFKLASQGFFEELTSPLFMGKEANVFTARTKDGGRIVVKMYRLENCNFNKMLDYIKPDPRYGHLKGGKRNIVFAWVQREYRNLLKARECIRVPTPLAFKDNILLMEFIGEDRPAIKIKDDPPKDWQRFYDKTVENMIKLYQGGLVHGDLSAFNILNHHDEPIFIDFSQATEVTNPNAEEMLVRDVKNICTFFGKKVKADEEDLLERLHDSRPR